MPHGRANIIEEALHILKALGIPPNRRTERAALCLLALLDLAPKKRWSEASDPLIGITAMTDFAHKHYGIEYSKNTRESFRDKIVYQFIETGIALYNPDDLARPMNHPKTCYQIEPKVLILIRKFNTPAWQRRLKIYLSRRITLIGHYAKKRKSDRIVLQIAPGNKIYMNPNDHNLLIQAILERFCPLYVPGGIPIYIGDTEGRWKYLDAHQLSKLGVVFDVHDKMPAVVVYYPKRNWLILIEAVTSHSPIDARRQSGLKQLFGNATAGLVFVTAFPSLRLSRPLIRIAWESEVWIADAPEHLIHFDGARFLGPYAENE